MDKGIDLRPQLKAKDKLKRKFRKVGLLKRVIKYVWKHLTKKQYSMLFVIMNAYFTLLYHVYIFN